MALIPGLPFSVFPVPTLNGRKPGISSSFRSADRPDHVGDDIMYPRLPSDGGPPGKRQLPSWAPRWYMPTGIPALAIGDAQVSTSQQIGTGGYTILDLADGWQAQYMHLARRDVRVGDTVRAGQQVGVIGANPQDGLIHLHLQLRKNGQLVDPASILAMLPLVSGPGGARDQTLLWLGIAAVFGLGVFYVLRD